MDPRSTVFADDVRSLLAKDRECAVRPVFSLDKAVSGLVLVRTGDCDSDRDLRLEDVECSFRCILLGRAGSSVGLVEGDEYAIEAPVQGELCTTKVQIISFTGSRNSPDGYLTTVKATPIGAFSQKQILCHFFDSPTPIIGNSRYTKQHRTCRDKGMFLSLTGLSYIDPETGERICVTHPEPTKFEALRAKEAKFFDRKNTEIEEALNTADASFGDKDCNDDSYDANAGKQTRNPAYIRGFQDFRGLSFKVTPDVMIPRPSSSILVDSSVKLFVESYQHSVPATINVLDMGTGSGSLLISTVKYLESHYPTDTSRPSIHGIALDASSAALAIAQQNLDSHQLSDRVQLKLGTFGTISAVLESLNHPLPQPVHICICNPPYLSPKTRTVTSIDPTLLNEEPAEALYAGPTGLEAYHEIAAGIREADEKLGINGFSSGCILAVEIAHGMASRVRACFEDSQNLEQRKWKFLDLKRDHKNMERCLLFVKKE
ncbi:S-adenosyl-L-methionine-dependent methyltransferase [Obelidium mucronatum]|nr:S-adenosyl-L-methionine-dependent methyltransferase [Obelidium mucronatum]